MKHFKVNLDRKKLTDEYIQSKQNFETVLKGAKSSKVNVWKSGWFYGTIGLSSLAVLVGVSMSNSKNLMNDKIITQTPITDEVVLSQVVDNNVQFASTTPTETKAIETAVLSEPVVKEVKVQQVSSSADENLEKVVTTSIKTVIEEETQSVVKEAEKKVSSISAIPSLSGVHRGDITWEKFKEGKIFIDETREVKSFNVQYTSRLGDKTVSVSGDKIPDEILQDLEKLGLNQTIFITNLVAEDASGLKFRFVSMDFNLKFK